MREQSSTPPTSPSVPLCPLREAIPAELRALSQWVCWRYEQRKGKPKPEKRPYTPGSGRLADPTDPATWRPFDLAWSAYQAGGYHGIGFVLSECDPYVFVDVDSCSDPDTGRLDEQGATTVAELGSYTERSPSGTGLHVVVRGELPGKGRKRGGVEVYDRGRYMTVTGHVPAGQPTEIAAANGNLDRLYASLGPRSSGGAGYAGNGGPSSGAGAAAAEGEIAEWLRSYRPNPRDTSPSGYFGSYVWATWKRWGERAVWEHAAEIEVLSGAHYGGRLREMIARSLAGVPPRDGDENRPGVVGRSCDALSARAERTVACQVPASAQGAADTAGAGAAPPTVLDRAQPAADRVTISRAEYEELQRYRAAWQRDDRVIMAADREQLRPVQTPVQKMGQLALHHTLRRPGAWDDGGQKDINGDLLAARMGCSADAARPALLSLQTAGLIARETRYVEDETREKRVTSYAIGRPPAPNEALDKPERPAPRAKLSAARATCPACGTVDALDEVLAVVGHVCEACHATFPLPAQDGQAGEASTARLDSPDSAVSCPRSDENGRSGPGRPGELSEPLAASAAQPDAVRLEAAAEEEGEGAGAVAANHGFPTNTVGVGSLAHAHARIAADHGYGSVGSVAANHGYTHAHAHTRTRIAANHGYGGGAGSRDAPGARRRRGGRLEYEPFKPLSSVAACAIVPAATEENANPAEPEGP